MKTNRISNKVKLLVLGVLSILMLVACGKQQPPENVSQEVWEELIQTSLYIIKTDKKKELLDDAGVVMENTDELTTEEREIYQKVLFMASNSMVKLATGLEDDYNRNYQDLVDVFGKSNLRLSNYDEKKFKLKMASAKNSKIEKAEENRKDFLKYNYIKLTGKDVQYNMANNVGKNFYLEGTVEICDYYNYGYTNEKSYFCGKFTPSVGEYGDGWYLYFERKGFEDLYNGIKSGGSSQELMINAVIPKNVYKSGQGNMALVKATKGLNQ